MNKRTILIILLAFVTTAGMYAQRGKRAIERIDRETQSRVFIPKGTWMVGGTVSYSEHEQDNLNFLVIKDVVGNGYDFAISPYVGYFFRNNMSAGIRFAYNRDYLDLGNLDMDLGDLTLSFKDLYYLEHKYEVSGFMRSYIPIGKSKVFGLFNEIRLTYFAPGLTAFITDWAAAEVSVGVMGFDFKWTDQTTNQVEQGRRRVSSGNFKINLFSINLGMTFYL